LLLFVIAGIIVGWMNVLATISVPRLNRTDLWRWVLVLMGLLLTGHELFSRHMRVRDAGSWAGLFRGRVLKRWWGIIAMSAFFVVIGIACIFAGFDRSFPR
jgi:hypothetical protein